MTRSTDITTSKPRGHVIKIPWVLVLIFCGVGAIALATNFYQPAERVVWRTDLAAARQEAAANGKPLFLDFTASWCPACQELKRTAWADSKVARVLAERYVAVSIDIDRQRDLATSYQVQAIPTFIVIDARTGRILKDDRRSPVPPEDILAWLNS